MGKNKKRDGKQKGAQEHAEGMHGDKTHAHLIQQLQSGPSRDPDHESVDRHGDRSHGSPGKHELFEGRGQRDEAERASEKNRLDRDIQDHKHVRENFQVRGGAESHPSMPRSKTNSGDPDAPNPASGLSPDEIPQRVPGVGAS